MADSKVKWDMVDVTGTFPFTGSVTGVGVADGSVTAAKLSGTIDASKITGALPAVDGSALIGLAGITKSASDPATDTNPSGGLGTLWANTTSGEIFNCTDATAGANVWTNVGTGTGDIPAPIPYQGSTTGYCAGGHQSGPSTYDRIDKFAFASSANFTASDVGNLSPSKMSFANGSSGTDGYAAGGGANPSFDIQKYSHTSDSDAVSHGSLNVWRGGHPAGCSDMSNQYGHVIGSYATGGGSPAASSREKYSFVSNVTATNSGDLVQAGHNQAGNSSTTYGYAAGGHSNGQAASFATIQKIAFATDVISEVYSGVLTKSRGSSGCSSLTHGFACGSYAISAPTGPQSRIDKYSFASEADATTVGELTAVIQGSVGCSSTNYGWVMGGQPPATTDRIDRFAFASQGNATDIGNLSLARVYAGSSQV